MNRINYKIKAILNNLFMVLVLNFICASAISYADDGNANAQKAYDYSSCKTLIIHTAISIDDKENSIDVYELDKRIASEYTAEVIKTKAQKYKKLLKTWNFDPTAWKKDIVSKFNKYQVFYSDSSGGSGIEDAVKANSNAYERCGIDFFVTIEVSPGGKNRISAFSELGRYYYQSNVNGALVLNPVYKEWPKLISMARYNYLEFRDDKDFLAGINEITENTIKNKNYLLNKINY